MLHTASLLTYDRGIGKSRSRNDLGLPHESGDGVVQDGSFENAHAGVLARIVALDDREDIAHARAVDGRGLALHGSNDLAIGDVVVIDDNLNFEIAPRRAWPVFDMVVTVRGVNDGDIIADIAGQARVLKCLNGDDFEDGNVIEYDEYSATARLVSGTPIYDSATTAPEALKSKFEVDIEKLSMTYADFGGYQEVVARAKKILQLQLDRSAEIKAIGGRPIRGVLFTGAPGTGKTLLAQIIAKESGAKFFVISGPQVVSEYVGASERALREIFETAAQHSKAIIFFDEIDSIATTRSEGSHEASVRLVAQLLTLMDGFSRDDGNIVVVAATNRPTEIDPALRRPGRFDWEVEFGLPSTHDRLEIMQKASRKMRLEDDPNLEHIADQTNGWSGAELTSVLTEAMLIAVGARRTVISDDDLVSGLRQAADQRLAKMGEGRHV